MNAAEEFNHYIAHLSEGLGHADRHAGLSGREGVMTTLLRSRGTFPSLKACPQTASAQVAPQTKTRG
jgi:hypothetical protein